VILIRRFTLMVHVWMDVILLINTEKPSRETSVIIHALGIGIYTGTALVFLLAPALLHISTEMT
jgi:hypothetical protein